MKFILQIIISLLNLFNSSFYSINIRTSSGLRLLELAAKGDTLTSQMYRPCRTFGKLSSFYIRRLRFASPTVNKVLSLRDLAIYKKYIRNLTALPLAEFSRLLKEKILFFCCKQKYRQRVMVLQSGCSVITVCL
jgi:hypothetical protein